VSAQRDGLIGQNAVVALQKITAPAPIEMTGFVVTDLDGAERSTGVVRCAKKVLQDGARTMARSQTYAWALQEERISGASAGISVDAAAVDDGIAAFVDAVLPRVQSGQLSLDAGKGVGPDALAALAAVDTRNPVRLTDATTGTGTLADELLARGAVAAASASIGELQGRSVVIEGGGSAVPTLMAVLAEAGARIVGLGTTTGTIAGTDGLDPATLAEAWASHGDGLPAALGSELAAAAAFTLDADVLFCGSKLGVIDHDRAAVLGQRLVVPIGPAPVTAKGLAVATRGGVTVLADFLTTSGALFADHPPAGATAQELNAAAIDWITATTREVSAHAEGPLLGACYRAEQFLTTWQDRLPFGRPLA
jgi:glutamate dehydrogenase/leucine dehydrogenase